MEPNLRKYVNEEAKIPNWQWTRLLFFYFPGVTQVIVYAYYSVINIQ